VCQAARTRWASPGVSIVDEVDERQRARAERGRGVHGEVEVGVEVIASADSAAEERDGLRARQGRAGRDHDPRSVRIAAQFGDDRLARPEIAGDEVGPD
jgi:hypothetical protein